jgi:serine/threonine protein kinase
MYQSGIDGLAESGAASDVLAPGTSLFHGNYTILKTLASGGFGITYLAKDGSGRNVVIKECYSGAHCRRNRTRVAARSFSFHSELTQIIRHFLREARNHSRITHPNVVRVHQVFQENDTAYMALDHIAGSDLVTLIEKEDPRLTPDWIARLAVKLIGALTYVHAEGILHCDIAPDNIFINEVDEPVLIDFGASRAGLEIPDSKLSGLSVVKDGYSPHELYSSKGKLGPWTDIYSLAATLSELISKEAPLQSQRRLLARAEGSPDPRKALAGNHPGYPEGFLESIDKAANLLQADRYQSAEDWMADLRSWAPQEEMNVKLLDKALSLRRKPRAERKTDTAARPGTKPDDKTTTNTKGKHMALDITKLSEIGGFIGACLVDSENGMMMAAVGGGKLDLEAASAANSEVVRAKNTAIQMLGLDDKIEDILISLGKQFHLIRPLEKTPSVFIYVALDRKAANLGMARVQVKQIEQTLSF